MGKQKIILIRSDPEPEPAPFVCPVCNETSPWWWAAHKGKFSFCSTHLRSRSLNANNKEMSWLDATQIRAAETIIWEIKNACTGNKRPAH